MVFFSYCLLQLSGIDGILITYIAFDCIRIGDCLCVIYFNTELAFAIDNAHSNLYYSADIANSFAIMIAEKRTVLQEIGNCFACLTLRIEKLVTVKPSACTRTFGPHHILKQYIQWYYSMQSAIGDIAIVIHRKRYWITLLLMVIRTCIRLQGIFAMVFDINGLFNKVLKIWFKIDWEIFILEIYFKPMNM